MKKLKSNFEGKLLSKTQMKGIGGGNSGWRCVCPDGVGSIFTGNDFNEVYQRVLSFCCYEGPIDCETMWTN